LEDLISIVVLILYFVVASTSKKKKKQDKAQKRAARKRAVQFERAFEKMLEENAEQAATAPEAESENKPVPHEVRTEEEGEDPCHEEMLAPKKPAMHLRIASQEEMHAAGEGEDPCHFGAALEETAFDEESPVYRSPIFHTEDKDAFAQDVLRGVVMSEVLRRPQRRA